MRYLFLLLLCLMTLPLDVRAQETVTFLFEDFDGVSHPDELEGWAVQEGWTVDAGTPAGNPASGENSLRIAGNIPGSAETPVLDLRRASTSAELSYFTRRTNSFDGESVQILASTDGGATYPILVVDATEVFPEDGGSWVFYSFPLPASLLGEQEVRFRIEYAGSGTASANARFDDFTITGLALFDVEPPRGLFAAEPGDTDVQTFTLYNYGEDALDVAAPLVSGNVFSIDPAAAVLVPAGEQQVYTITFAPQEDDVFEESVEISAAGAGAMTLPLRGITSINLLAFQTEESIVGEFEEVVVPLRLSFNNEEELQGFQTVISWDLDLLAVSDVTRGPSIANNGWSLSYEPGPQSVKIIVFNDADGGLATGHYEPIVELHLTALLLGNGNQDVTLSIDEVIGALAVPTADDAELMIDEGVHVITIEQRDAYLEASETELNFGYHVVNTTDELTFTLSNPAGERSLTINQITSEDEVFSVIPTSASIDPNETVLFTVTFAPTAVLAGLRTAQLEIDHDGTPAGPLTIDLSGVGTYGRGDNDGDGMVDAMDIVNTIDFILEREEPSALALTASDLFPFDTGDGALDVRDLTISVQAIVRGIWPDEVPVPPVIEDPIEASKRGGEAPVRVIAKDDGNDLVLELEHDVPMRALQVHLRVEHLVGEPVLLLNSEGAPTASGRIERDAASGMVRILLYRPDGGAMQPGSYTFAMVPREAAGGFVARRYATAVDQTNDRLSVEIIGLVGSTTDPVPRHLTFSVDPAYPNPFSRQVAPEIRVPVTGTGERIVFQVYDLLGRRIAVQEIQVHGRTELRWNGTDGAGTDVAPGLYLMQIRSGSSIHTQRVVVVR